MALIQPHAAVRCPALAERAHARGRRNVLVRHGSRSRRGGDGRGPGWWGSRARVRRVVWHAPRSPRVPSSTPPLVIALPEPVRRPCPSLPRPLGPCREDLCARARASARRFFPPHFSRATRPRTREGDAEGASIKGDGANQPTPQKKQVNQYQSITPSLNPGTPRLPRSTRGRTTRQPRSISRSVGGPRQACAVVCQPTKSRARSMAMDESIDRSIEGRVSSWVARLCPLSAIRYSRHPPACWGAAAGIRRKTHLLLR